MVATILYFYIGSCHLSKSSKFIFLILFFLKNISIFFSFKTYIFNSSNKVHYITFILIIYNKIYIFYF